MTLALRGDEPRLTAPDVDQAGFALTPWGRRGYDQAAVDAFLDRVRDELRMCANEATGLREEVMRLRRRFVASQRGEPGEWLADAQEAHAMAVAIVSGAQATADRYVADAQAYAGQLAQDAAGRREEMLAEAERVLAAAREQARDAADAALDEPVPEQADGPLRAARAAAAYRGTFDGVYLTHVSMLVDTLQQMLSDWKRKDLGGGQEPEGAAAAAVPAEIAAAGEEAR